ncbi:LOW QUALITY PROTEIN: calpain-5-like [Liolophura sinensis]|uniref:LOW QUALITY PROTEIN: calpain-5-like n=1 Tax=Liolophura sinensis TaxID=3198878 RepID=UPI00315857A8
MMKIFGETVEPYKNQHYAALKKDCQAKGHLFYDMEFPPEDRSLFYTPGKLSGVQWKRPKDICSTPKLFVGGASSGDVHQGRLGNCWFVAACSCLAQYKEIWHRVIPDHEEQEFNDEKPETYAGIFHFQFWRYGQWVDVVVDDHLPTINDQLVFIHSQSNNEFWSALLEKAYAKLFGTYEALDGGDLAEALEDFTGGVSDPIDMVALNVATDLDARHTYFKRMQKDMERKSLMAAAIPAKSSEEMETSTDVGLVRGHAYGVTDVKSVPLEGTGIFGMFNRDTMPMIRLRNPWGQGEWKGAFSDGSPEWQKISESDRRKIGLTFDEDGEFWMTFEDYCKNFTNTSICRVVNTSLFSIKKTWHEGLAHAAWSKPNLAGGCLNNRDTFLNNPQFVFDVGQADDDVMFQLMQKSTRGRSGGENVTIGFSLLKVEENRRYRLHQLQEVVQSSVFKNSRSIFMRPTLVKGRYVIVACTFEAGVELEFLLRIYTSAPNGFKHMLLDQPKAPWYNCCAKQAQMVTRIKVIRAQGLERQDKQGGADPYCVISCEGEKVYTNVVKDNVNPEWNSSAIFYRTDPVQKPIKIQVWNHNIIKDEYMGKHVLMGSDECSAKMVEVDLFGRKNESNVKKPGKLILEITSSRNLTLL